MTPRSSQEVCDGGLPAILRPSERSRLVLVVADSGVRARIEQHPRQVDRTPFRGHVQRGVMARMVEPMVGVQELAKLYGNPRSWWYQAAESGRVPSYRIGKYRKFRVSEIEAWLTEQRQGTRVHGEPGQKELARTRTTPAADTGRR